MAVADIDFRATREWAAWSALLLLAGIALIVTTVDLRPLAQTAPLWAPIGLVTAGPMAFVWLRLRTPGDPLGIRLAAALSAIMLIVLGVAAIGWVATTLTGDAVDTSVRLIALLFPPRLQLVVFVGLLGFTLSRVLVNARRAMGHVAGQPAAIGYHTRLVLLFGVVVCLAPLAYEREGEGLGLATLPEPAPGAPYSGTTAVHYLGRAYQCLWGYAGPGAAEGFPATLDELERVCPLRSFKGRPGGPAYGTNFLVTYTPSAPDRAGRFRAFRLETQDATKRRGAADLYWVDQTGLVRFRDGRRVVPRERLYNAPHCSTLRDFERELDAYRAAHPEQGYPETAPATWAARLPGWDIVYRPLALRSAVRDAYTLSLAPRPETRRLPGDLEQATFLSDIRSYYRDDYGTIHGTGEPRAATASDPWAGECAVTPRP